MRIVAGEFRGRTLTAPAGDATRPTAARAREALFSILAQVSEARVLDLYAGSGALGFEALSRGAERATLLPLRTEASFSALARHGPFSLVFADPPWADAQAAFGVLLRLASASLLSPAARLVLEHAARGAPNVPENSPLCQVDTRRWGDTAVTIFAVESGPGAGT